MKSGYNCKVLELQEVLKNIKLQELALEKSGNQIKSSEVIKLEKNISKLKEKKEKLNEELVENEDLSETIRMKYAIMFLLNFGETQSEYCI